MTASEFLLVDSLPAAILFALGSGHLMPGVFSRIADAVGGVPRAVANGLGGVAGSMANGPSDGARGVPDGARAVFDGFFGFFDL
ncbi:MAG TPA: hypothetical protein VN809_13535 [Telmatospirillum sp.]|nr:hypothetical protein [Telmatospirillum sp.]